MSISNHVLKHGITLGTAKVISNDILPKGASIPGRILNSIGSITIHNTGLVDVKANNFHRSLKRENALKNGRQASWTFSVDDTEIYQETKINWETWHAGKAVGNKNSISIEICMWSDKEKQRKSYENTAILVAMLLKTYGLKISDIKQHYNWSGKNCPIFLRQNKYGYDWNWFISRVQYHLTAKDNTTSNEYKVGELQKDVIITADTLNVRSGRGAEFNKIGSFKKNQKVTVWYIGKAKDGSLWGSCSCDNKTGYIHMGYTKQA